MFSVFSNATKATILFSSIPSATRCISQQALSIRQKIEKKRSGAMLGGGQHRIDAQHKKV